MSPEAAAFAREAVAAAAPQGRDRAKNLLRAAGKLADYAIPLGLEAVPEVLLHQRSGGRPSGRRIGSEPLNLQGIKLPGLDFPSERSTSVLRRWAAK